MRKISNWPGWLVSLFLLVATYLLSNGDWVGTEHVKQISGGAGTLDAFFYFTPDKAYEVLAALGESGRQAYLTNNLVNFIFPLTYAFFFAISLTMCYTFVFPAKSKWNWLIPLPFVGMLVDFGDHACVRALLLAYPQPMPSVAVAASLLAGLKYTIIVVSAFLILQANMKVTSKLFTKK